MLLCDECLGPTPNPVQNYFFKAKKYFCSEKCKEQFCNREFSQNKKKDV